MKKILSVLCALALIASFACFSVSADDAVVGPTFAIVADPVAPEATQITASLVVTLPEGATGYALGCFAVDMSYDPAVMTLAEDVTWEVKGTTMNSENPTDLPYMFLWATVSPKQQLSVDEPNVVATMIFDLAKPAAIGDTYEITIALNAENPTMSMEDKDDASIVERPYAAEELTFVPANITVAEPVITTEATVTDPIVTDPIVTDPIGTDVVTEDPGDVNVTSDVKTDVPGDVDVTSDEETDAPAASSEVTTTTTAATTKAPAKANQTGDMMFVVVAVMVVALGAAVVIKKVNVK